MSPQTAVDKKTHALPPTHAVIAPQTTIPELPTSLKAEPTPELEATDSGSENMVYVFGLGWIESQGLNQVTYADDMYKNENKIGIMD